MKRVVNAVPDNRPVGLHLSEGAIHAVQTPFAYLGYKTLDGFAKTPLRGIPEGELKMVGRFIDHELLVGERDPSSLVQRFTFSAIRIPASRISAEIPVKRKVSAETAEVSAAVPSRGQS